MQVSGVENSRHSLFCKENASNWKVKPVTVTRNSMRDPSGRAE